VTRRRDAGAPRFMAKSAPGIVRLPGASDVTTITNASLRRGAAHVATFQLKALR
jgi:hypothetical protein